MSDTICQIRGVTIIGGPLVNLRGLKIHLPETLKEVVRRWHNWFLPRHFQPGAVAHYGYKPRKERYLKRNRGRGYIVKSGLTRTQATRAIFIRGGPRTVTGKMFVPSYVTRRYRDTDRPNLPMEIKKVIPAEHRQMVQFVHDTLLPKIRRAMWIGEVKISA